MENIIKVNDTSYTITSTGENEELVAQIIKACEAFYKVEEEYNQTKFEYDQAKLMMEQLFGKGFEEIGLKSIKSRYVNASYIPEGKPTTKLVPNEEMIIKLLEELGVATGDYFVEKEIKGRKASVRWTNK